MSIERTNEHIKMLNSFLKAEVEESLADSERRLAEAITNGEEGARMFYQESVDSLRAFRTRFEGKEEAAA